MTLFEAHEAHVLKSEAQSEAQSVAQSEVQTGTKTMKETYNMLYTSEMMISFLRKNLCITLRHMWYTFRKWGTKWGTTWGTPTESRWYTQQTNYWSYAINKKMRINNLWHYQGVKAHLLKPTTKVLKPTL